MFLLNLMQKNMKRKNAIFFINFNIFLITIITFIAIFYFPFVDLTTVLSPESNNSNKISSSSSGAVASSSEAFFVTKLKYSNSEIKQKTPFKAIIPVIPSETTKLEYLLENILLSKNNNVRNKLLKSLEKNENLLLKSDEIVDAAPVASNSNKNKSDSEKTFVDWYHEGVDAYEDKDWKNCIRFIKTALNLYHAYYEKITACRMECENNKRSIFKPQFEIDYDNMHFFEGMIFKTLCLEKCRRRRFQDSSKYFIFGMEEGQHFKKRVPYQYLQLCYYKKNQIENAMSATYTVLAIDPGNELMKSNYDYYKRTEEFNLTNIKDFEDKDFSVPYQDAMDKYNQDDWEATINLLEATIEIWLHEHNKCRMFCEGEFYQGWLADLVTSISNHYVHTLRCKQKCKKELSFINGGFYEDLYPSMYDYLQYAYFKIGNKKAAVQCAQTYSLFVPRSIHMKKNLEFYAAEADVTKDFFKPRKVWHFKFTRLQSKFNLLQIKFTRWQIKFNLLQIKLIFILFYVNIRNYRLKLCILLHKWTYIKLQEGKHTNITNQKQDTPI